MNKKIMLAVLILIIILAVLIFVIKFIPGTKPQLSSNSKLCDCLTGVNTDYKQCDAVTSQGKYSGEGDEETNKMKAAIDGLSCVIKNGNSNYVVTFSKDESLKIVDENNKVLLDNAKVSITAPWFITHGLSVLNLKDDVNFDGYNDLAVLTGIGYGGVTEAYDYFIFNSQSGNFDKDSVLTNVCNPKFDIKQKVILSSCKSGIGYNEAIYRFNGKNYDPINTTFDWQEYHNDAYDFSFQYPKGWEIDYGSKTDPSIKLTPSSSEGQFFTENDNILIPAVKISWVPKTIDNILKSSSSTSPKPVTIKSKSGVTFVVYNHDYYLDLANGETLIIYDNSYHYEAYDGTVVPKIIDSFTSTRVVTNADWKQYTNTEYGIAFKYPSDWTFKESKNKIGTLIELNPDGLNLMSEMGGYFPAVSVRLENNRTFDEIIGGFYLLPYQKIKTMTTSNGLVFHYLTNAGGLPDGTYYLDILRDGQSKSLVVSTATGYETFDDSIVPKILNTFLKV